MKNFFLLIVPLIILSSCKKNDTNINVDFELYSSSKIDRYFVTDGFEENTLYTNNSPIGKDLTGSSNYRFVYSGNINIDKPQKLKFIIPKTRDITSLKLVLQNKEITNFKEDKVKNRYIIEGRGY